MQRWEIEAKLNRSRADLLEAYASMSEAERHRPSTQSEADPTKQWSALDHFLHIISPEQQAMDAIRRQMAGEEFPYPPLMDEAGERLPPEVFLPKVHRLNDSWLEQNRALSFDEVVTLGQTIRAGTIQLLAELSERQLAEPLRNMPWSVFCGDISELFALIARHSDSHYQQAIAGWAAGAGHIRS